MTTTPSIVRPEVVPLAGRIGAEIVGVDAGADVSDETIAAIRQALLDHRVVFLRDQHLDYEREVALAQRFGGASRSVTPRWRRPPTSPSWRRSTYAPAVRPTSGTPTSPSSPVPRRSPSCTAWSSRRWVVTPSGPTRWPPTITCRPSWPTWPERCGSSTPTPTTTPRPSLGATTSTRSWPPTAPSSCPPSTRPSTRRSACTPRRVSCRWCWAASPSRWSGLGRRPAAT